VLQNGVTGSDLGFVGLSAESLVLVDEAGHGVVAFDSERGQAEQMTFNFWILGLIPRVAHKIDIDVERQRLWATVVEP
jgi:hypothetical protein